ASIAAFTSVKWFQQRYSPTLRDLHTKKVLIAELAETIIPKTDTPGANDANVHLFILHAITNCTNPRNQRNFLNGLIIYKRGKLPEPKVIEKEKDLPKTVEKKK
ncbi:MAG: gluconate 2-dehydrogenase subunit 3 family protein, partial [Pedobacter sp.]